MKISSLIGAVGGAAGLVAGSCTATIVVGAIYLVDCRISAKGPDAVDKCYFTALPLMGIGIAGGVGYNTYNPALRKEEKTGGIFRGRDKGA